MRHVLRRALLLTPILAALAQPLRAQRAGSVARFDTRFFDTVEPLELTLTANFGRLRRDQQAEPPWRWAAISSAASPPVSVPLRVRTRGIWRRKHCAMPPLRLDFARDSVAQTVFAGLDRPKLVQACNEQGRSEQYLLQEYQLYRIYQLLLPAYAHRVRLARITYVDSGRTEARTTRYAFFLEEPAALAARAGGRMIDTRKLTSGDLDDHSRGVLGVFQYFIGNTDWSTSGLHNVELLQIGDTIHPIAFDFDYSGAVDAHYAIPDPRVPIRSVRQRIFRGHCVSEPMFMRVLDEFRRQRPAIHALYDDAVGSLIEPRVKQRALDYFNEFFALIDRPEDVRKAIISRCASSQ